MQASNSASRRATLASSSAIRYSASLNVCLWDWRSCSRSVRRETITAEAYARRSSSDSLTRCWSRLRVIGSTCPKLPNSQLQGKGRCRLVELTTNRRDKCFASDYEARGYSRSRSRLSGMSSLSIVKQQTKGPPFSTN